MLCCAVLACREVNTVLMTETEVFSGSDDHTISVWDLRAAKQRRVLQHHHG